MLTLQPRLLKVRTLHHPRGYTGPLQGWELDRGFRLRVLSRGAVLLYLRSSASAMVEDFLSPRPTPGEECFLIVPEPEGRVAEPLLEALTCLRAEGWWPDTVLLFSDWCARRAPSPERIDCPSFVGWVFQEMPRETRNGLAYFTPEQTLYQLGRIGRHVQRRCRWRGWLPF